MVKIIAKILCNLIILSAQSIQIETRLWNKKNKAIVIDNINY